jgi:hypothetical protein
MRAIWWAAFAATILGSSPAAAINTRAVWDGSTTIGLFGCPNTTNYGQTIVVPKFKHTLRKIVYYLTGQAAVGSSMTVRAEVYQWDDANQRPTGSAVYESDPQTISYSDAKFHRLTFIPNASVTPGAQYVVFVTVDKDFAQCNGYGLSWASVSDIIYPRGTFVFLNSNGDASQWETTPWTTNFGYDLALKIFFSK